MRALIVLIPGLSWLAACNTTAGREGHQTVPANETRSIGFFSSLAHDCASKGPITITVTQKPAHGATSVRRDTDYPQHVVDRVPERCAAVRVPGTRLLYTPRRGFLGDDRIALRLELPDGRSLSTSTNLHVK